MDLLSPNSLLLPFNGRSSQPGEQQHSNKTKKITQFEIGEREGRAYQLNITIKKIGIYIPP